MDGKHQMHNLSTRHFNFDELVIDRLRAGPFPSPEISPLNCCFRGFRAVHQSEERNNHPALRSYCPQIDPTAVQAQFDVLAAPSISTVRCITNTFHQDSSVYYQDIPSGKFDVLAAPSIRTAASPRSLNIQH